MSERAIAINEGRKKYNTGKPCKRGHFADRFTVTMNCVECVKLYRKTTNQRLNQARYDIAMGHIAVTVTVRAQDAQFIRDMAKMSNDNNEAHIRLVGDYCRALGLAMKFDEI